MGKSLFLFLFSVLTFSSFGQNSFDYTLVLEPVNIPNLPGVHSYAVGQHDGKWLVIGGRRDGLHARQPFASFPENMNNQELFVIDVASQQFWSTTLTSLPTGIKEQLQSTNMNFFQDGDSLYIIGGYAHANSVGSKITFPNLTSVIVSQTIDAIINGTSITPYFKQITDDNFAISGGQMGKMGNKIYLIGGHRFDGNYNPMGNATYTQTYSNAIRSFNIDNSGSQLSYSNFTEVVDAVHLHRRDYNLLPQIFPDGQEGYTISSGVFQINIDLPFLYPVDITQNGYTPHTNFNQYLSNYHSASAYLYDGVNNNMHSLFFGGMSQYHYVNGQLIQDNNVPFVNTISRLTRFSDSTLQEFQMPIDMPGLKGASAEFIPNHQLPHTESEIILLDQIPDNEFIIGYIYGGIYSPNENPFTNNNTDVTAADASVYAVKLIVGEPVGVVEIEGKTPYSMSVYPNPFDKDFYFELEVDKHMDIDYFISDTNGKILDKGYYETGAGTFKAKVKTDRKWNAQTIFLTVVVDDKYFLTQELIRE